jgi:hypothetical protein
MSWESAAISGVNLSMLVRIYPITCFPHARYAWY